MESLERVRLDIVVRGEKILCAVAAYIYTHT